MIYETYKEKKFGEDALAKIETAHRLIQEYKEQGYTLTLRQLYYQFVSRNIIPNTERSYKNLGVLITDARMAGELPWDGIEDRARESKSPYVNEDIHGIFHSLDYHFAADFWRDQDTYIEVWVEKEALGNVVERPCSDMRVTHMACKGYLSASQAWAAGNRFRDAAERDKRCVLLHLGDHDPSGIDMTRDNEERANMFSMAHVEVRRLALNTEQVDRYSPPPNPAKLTDSRASDYIRRFGDTSWELDALEPSVIDRLIRNTIQEYVDPAVWEEAEEREREAKTHLKKFFNHYDKIDKFVRNIGQE